MPALAAALMTACGGAATNIAVNIANTNAANTAANTNANAVANIANASVNTNVNANAVKPAAIGPTRIVFVKGGTSADQSITLVAGAAKQFVVGAKKGQFLVVEPSSDKLSPSDLKITFVTKGKTTAGDLSEFLSATLNADGDYIFEVKNTSKKEITVPLHIQIDDGPGD